MLSQLPLVLTVAASGRSTSAAGCLISLTYWSVPHSICLKTADGMYRLANSATSFLTAFLKTTPQELRAAMNPPRMPYKHLMIRYKSLDIAAPRTAKNGAHDYAECRGHMTSAQIKLRTTSLESFGCSAFPVLGSDSSTHVLFREASLVMLSWSSLKQFSMRVSYSCVAYLMVGKVYLDSSLAKSILQN